MNLIFRGTNRFRDRFDGSAGRQETISEVLMGPLRINDARHCSVGKNFPALGLKKSFSTASTQSGHEVNVVVQPVPTSRKQAILLTELLRDLRSPCDVYKTRS